MHRAEKARDTTLDDEKYDVRYTRRRHRNKVYVLSALAATGIFIWEGAIA